MAFYFISEMSVVSMAITMMSVAKNPTDLAVILISTGFKSVRAEGKTSTPRLLDTRSNSGHTTFLSSEGH